MNSIAWDQGAGSLDSITLPAEPNIQNGLLHNLSIRGIKFPYSRENMAPATKGLTAWDDFTESAARSWKRCEGCGVGAFI